MKNDYLTADFIAGEFTEFQIEMALEILRTRRKRRNRTRKK